MSLSVHACLPAYLYVSVYRAVCVSDRDSLEAEVVLAHGLAPLAVVLGQEAVGEPQDAVLALPLGRQDAQHQDHQDDGRGHRAQVQPLRRVGRRCVITWETRQDETSRVRTHGT